MSLKNRPGRAKGSPTTLNEAIRNGLEESKTELLAGMSVDSAKIIESHVRDFVAQKFGAAYLQGDLKMVDQFELLWKAITHKGDV